MKNNPSKSGSIFAWVLLGAILLSTGCAPANTLNNAAVAVETSAATSLAVPTNAAAETAAVVPLETSAATSTTVPTTRGPEETQTVPTAPLPSATTEQGTETTSNAGLTVEKGITAWCLPLNTAVSYAKDPLNPPSFAKKAKFSNGTLEVSNLPASGCMFLFTFDKIAPTGLKLEIYENNQPKPFLKADLQTASGSPETLWAFVQHAVIVSPSVANSSFSLMVRDPLGQVVQKAQIKLHSWVAGTPGPDQNGDEDDCGCGAEPPPPPPED